MDNTTTTQPATTEPQTYVSFTDYTTQALSCTPPEKKTVPNTGGQTGKPEQNYNRIALMYDMGKDGKRAVNDFLLEGCEMESSIGIQSKLAQNGVSMEHSLMCRFDPNNEEQMRFLEVMGQIHAGSCYIVGQFKGPLKMFDFNPQAPGQTFKSPVYRPRDELTGEFIPGRSPSMFWKLFSRGKPPMVEQTLFTDLEGKAIPWTLLQGVEMKFIPLIHIKNIYCGGKGCSLQIEIVSAIVTSIRARNTAVRNTATLQRLREARPELADQVAGQLAKLTLDRQEQMLGVQAVGALANTADTDEGQPTFAGITRVEQRPAVQAQITQPAGSPQYGALPAIPPLAGTPTLQDFTAAAPTRNPAIPVVTLPAEVAPMTGTPVQLN